MRTRPLLVSPLFYCSLFFERVGIEGGSRLLNKETIAIHLNADTLSDLSPRHIASSHFLRYVDWDLVL